MDGDGHGPDSDLRNPTTISDLAWCYSSAQNQDSALPR